MTLSEMPAKAVCHDADLCQRHSVSMPMNRKTTTEIYEASSPKVQQLIDRTLAVFQKLSLHEQVRFVEQVQATVTRKVFTHQRN